jgi:hypothetical protein
MSSKRILLALALEAVLISVLLIVVVDVIAHTHVEELGGVNVWGYRSAVAHQRQPFEIRVAIVGGTRAFAWGQGGAALAGEVRRQIMLSTDRPGSQLRPIVVINLARVGASPESYAPTIEHYGYLQPDYICLYDDLGVRGAKAASGASAIYRLTGYAPALPLVLQEKGLAWRFGTVARGYAALSERRAADAPLLRRTAGSLLYWIGNRLSTFDAPTIAPSASDQAATTGDVEGSRYIDAMSAAIDTARQHARAVVVATSPVETDLQANNLRALRDRLPIDTSAPWLRLVDFSSDATLRDPASRLDGWSYGSAGTAIVAGRLAAALLTLIPPL